MKSTEEKIKKESEYFVSTPSALAAELFFYISSIGKFTYEQGYALQRENFDSFLIIYIAAGKMRFASKNEYVARPGEIVLIDCYEPHAYYAEEETTAYWLHFDGVMARQYFEQISLMHTSNEVIGIDGSKYRKSLQRLYDSYANQTPMSEPEQTVLLTEYLTGFMSQESVEKVDTPDAIWESKNYILNHFAEPLSVDELAFMSGFSTYHYIRKFKEYMGITPHEYLMSVRLGNASYLLKNTVSSITDICYKCGYSSSSAFTTAFKREFGCAPKDYRRERTSSNYE